MRVRDVLTAKPRGDRVETIGAGEPLGMVARRLDELGIGALLVTDGDDVVGLVSERDLISALARYGARALLVAAAEAMTRELVVCSPDDSIGDIMAIMTSRRIRHLPVVEERRLMGLISIGDVVKHRLGESEDEAEALRTYLYSTR
jgi:CBS domain-containing protein